MNIPSTHQDYKMEFVVFALESAAKKAQIPTEELYKRMEKQGLIEKFLFECYDTLHTQGRDYIADVTLEALHNWEEAANDKEVNQWPRSMHLLARELKDTQEEQLHGSMQSYCCKLR